MDQITPVSRKPRSAGVSNIGQVRQSNQDTILADDAAGLWLVADGMGGHAGGACASAIARDTIRDRFVEHGDLRQAVLDAHVAICASQLDNPEFNDMGTTVVALAERSASFEIVWVGDSRAYRFSRQSYALSPLTRDHNVAGMLVAAGALSPSEAARHPQRHVLTDCLGLTGEHEPRVGSMQDRWQPDEWILLCSDGLTGELDDAEIQQTLAAARDLESAQQELLEKSLDAGAHDNVSLVLIAGPDQPEVEGQPRTRWPWPFRRRAL